MKLMQIKNLFGMANAFKPANSESRLGAIRSTSG